MAAVVPEEEHAPSLIVAEREAPARGEEAEVLEMGVVLGVEVEEVPARSEEAEVLGATCVVQGVVVDEGPPLTNGSLRDWVKRWCSGDRGGLPPISTWNTSQVTDMSFLFGVRHGWMEGDSQYNGCVLSTASFNENISAWDTSSVKNMESMFCGASAFNQPLGDWSVDKVTNMCGMFQGAWAFNQPIGDWSVDKVTNMCWINMCGMFGGAWAFN